MIRNILAKLIIMYLTNAFNQWIEPNILLNFIIKILTLVYYNT